ncbi:hypothetical protein Kirov_77 [Bacillus phage Kirov]|uniref:Uncharacterized protein n=1 Tax=Bacillus phage Kirov TaxID=2783539 RepID=A0A7U3NJT5_9CAUD|nr:hypothetical protein PQE67_gp227 [Bacillus phage Kirov]QOV08276.1 hypothetical protein Kirov_77 [Bacillus phage Kirov]
MKVVVTELVSEDFDYEMLEIVIDDTTKFKVDNADDSPEDNTLSRNFSDCYDIPALLKKAWEAGKRGEEFNLYYVKGDKY